MDTENKNHSTGSSEPRTIILKPRRVDYPRRDREHREEYAAEVTPYKAPASMLAPAEDAGETIADGKTMGYVGLGFGIASLFLWSIVLGPVAAVIGYFAYNRGQKTTGAWAMGLGIVATLSYFVMIPFAR
ncbi:hypothetical protein PaeBR_08890 [Paenibacillus sp. BR2-3]|uniref:hypothetical protein n=1 Tax=Paenibacillus sp. BR2-3 TaxID=3048494 RepID=UPI003977C259